MQERGYAGISVQNIADALGFSKANFFYHLRSKENLLHAIFIEPLRFTIGKVEEIVQREESGEARLRAIVDLYVHLVTERTAEMQAWFNEKGHLSKPHLREVTRAERHLVLLLVTFFSDGVARGEFRDIDPRLAINVLVAMCFSLTRLQPAPSRFSLPDLSTQMQLLACGAFLTAFVPRDPQYTQQITLLPGENRLAVRGPEANPGSISGGGAPPNHLGAHGRGWCGRRLASEPPTTGVASPWCPT